MEATNGISGFRKLLKDRGRATVVELPSMGILDDGRPFAVKFRQLRPIEWWATRFGEFGDLPIISEAPADMDERGLALFRKQNVREMSEQYTWARAIAGTAVTHFRDVVDDEGVWREVWVPVTLAAPGTKRDIVDVSPDETIVPIEMLEVGSTVQDIANAIIQHANFGGNEIKESNFRVSADRLREDGGSVQGDSSA